MWILVGQGNISGHILSKEGISVNSKKVEVVLHKEDPQILRKLKNFLGLAGYYRWFVEGFSMTVSPLLKLTRKHNIFEWTVKCEQAFQELKHRLTTTPILALPLGIGNFVIYSDASRQGLVVP